MTVTAIHKIKDRSIKNYIKFYVAWRFIHKVYYNLKTSYQKYFVRQLLCNLKMLNLLNPYVVRLAARCPKYVLRLPNV